MRKKTKHKWRSPAVHNNNNNNNKLVVKVNNKVEHHYTDFAHVSEGDLTAITTSASSGRSSRSRKNKHHLTEFYFPVRLYDMLRASEQEGLEEIISWQPHGRCFLIRNQERFAEEILPRFFTCSKFTSFQRQLSLYDFKRLTRGRDRGGYYHEAFLRGKRFLAHRIPRMKIKGTKCRQASSPETEPNFYHIDLPYLPPSSSSSSSSSSNNETEELEKKEEEEMEDIPQEKKNQKTDSSATEIDQQKNQDQTSQLREQQQQQQEEQHGNLSLLSKAAQSRLLESSRTVVVNQNKIKTTTAEVAPAAALKPKPHLASRQVRFHIPSAETTQTSELQTAEMLQHTSDPASQQQQHVPAPAPPAPTVSPIGDDRVRVSHGFLDSSTVLGSVESPRQRSLFAAPPPRNMGPRSNNNDNNRPIAPPPLDAIFPPQQVASVQPTSYSFPLLPPLQQQPQQQQPQQQPVVVLILPGALPPGCLNDPVRAAAAVASLLQGGGGG